MRIVLYAVVAIVAFCATVVGTLYFTGALDKESLVRLKGSFSKAPQKVEEGTKPQQAAQEVSVATALREKEKQIAQREKELAEEKERLDQERAEFDEIMKKVDGSLKQMAKQVDSLGAEEAKQVSDLAKTYAEMRPEKAAKILQGMPVENSVNILKRIVPRKRAQIIEKMENASEISEAIIAKVGVSG
jgi:flagellar motility protein MotE (MotC chaperone)